MRNRRNITRAAAILFGMAVSMGASASCQDAKSVAAPETVIISFHAEQGAESDLQRMIAEHWTVARRLNLVRESPRVTLRGTEQGDRVYFVDIFTWRDAAIPDAAPQEIRKIWDQMNRLAEARGGQTGLSLAAVSLLEP